MYFARFRLKIYEWPDTRLWLTKMFKNMTDRKIIFLIAFINAFLLIFWYFFLHRERCHISMPFEEILKRPNENSSLKNLCMLNLNELGSGEKDINVNFIPSFESTKKLNPALKEGGTWKPAKCQSLQKVAIIIPYRDRIEHLKILLHRLHPMLQKQQIEYRIFLVEQYGTKTFNKGKIMNIGFQEALKIDDFDCFVFHDVDLIPETDRNLYLCDKEIRHLSPAIDEMRYQLPYEQLIGGVMAIGPRNFEKINGYSTMYWGWGGEDDDLACRTGEVNLTISRPPQFIGRYKMIPHLKSAKSGNAFTMFLTWRSRWKWDGLNSKKLMSHEIKSIENKDLFTHIMIDVGPMPSDLLTVIGKLEAESIWWSIKFYNP